MSMFSDESFDCAIDKGMHFYCGDLFLAIIDTSGFTYVFFYKLLGTLDSLMVSR
jgi:hypothetical protein